MPLVRRAAEHRADRHHQAAEAERDLGGVDLELDDVADAAGARSASRWRATDGQVARGDVLVETGQPEPPAVQARRDRRWRRCRRRSSTFTIARALLSHPSVGRRFAHRRIGKCDGSCVPCAWPSRLPWSASSASPDVDNGAKVRVACRGTLAGLLRHPSPGRRRSRRCSSRPPYLSNPAEADLLARDDVRRGRGRGDRPAPCCGSTRTRSPALTSEGRGAHWRRWVRGRGCGCRRPASWRSPVSWPPSWSAGTADDVDSGAADHDVDGHDVVAVDHHDDHGAADHHRAAGHRAAGHALPPDAPPPDVVPIGVVATPSGLLGAGRRRPRRRVLRGADPVRRPGHGRRHPVGWDRRRARPRSRRRRTRRRRAERAAREGSQPRRRPARSPSSCGPRVARWC